MHRLRTALMVVLVCALMGWLSGCGGGSTSSSSNSNGGNGNPRGSTQANAQGTVLVPNGSKGVAVIHIEDNSGNLMATPAVTNVPAAGPVTVLAEPPDFSQGVVASAQALQTLNTASTTPQLTDNVSVSGDGNAISAAVITGSTFSVVQMSQLAGYATTCFTGGLHMAGGQTLSPGAAQAVAFNVSPDGTVMAQWNTSATLELWLVTATTSPHAVSFGNLATFNVASPIVSGRGALAFDPTSSILLQGGSDGSLNAVTSLKTAPSGSGVFLPGTPAVTSIAYAPNGKYAVVATNAGLFTITLDSTGTPVVGAGPVNSSYKGSDGNTYQLSGAQSIAITQDGKYLVALTDQPSATNGTLVAMPIDASGNIGSVGMVKGGLLATQNMDVLFAH